MMGGAAGAIAGAGAIMDIITPFMNVGHSALQAGKQRDWTEHAMRHRYRWAVEDLRKAGLNPILAYGHGPGNVPTPGIIGAASHGGAGASARGLATLKAELDKRDAE